ncbi:MAG: histidine triad nucleotide-binding protein [Thermotogae bacterium]|nr:histidine triad nucleotide-binding protein [Thermotogota bacterium]
MACVFCRIVKGELPAKVVYEDDKVMAFHDINPQAPIHVLLIPKKHVENLFEEIDQELAYALIRGLRETVKKLGIEAYRVVSNNGKGAGQEVFHLHFHIVAGRRIPPTTV